MSIPVWGLILQVLFISVISIFNNIRISIMEHLFVYPVAFFELFLGLASFVSGIYGIIKRVKPLLSILVSFFGVLICLYFVFVYLLPEAGIPPVIPWFYSE
ncbi:hypothetical protein [Peribacillus loiseleuriae]|uniref:Uncharacterized protein n=1 Tax=Peribacillus loiseleuriae TaxID=1679170 RepID=A0A0K9GU53_9BACI|nr:hypothetical protein [Peribacillus loiseleuriae]KMY50148.1 hypothetical protein AC625_12095 [Peribacillus loiseleuriae]